MYITIFGIEGPSRKAYIHVHTETLVTSASLRKTLLDIMLEKFKNNTQGRG